MSRVENLNTLVFQVRNNTLNTLNRTYIENHQKELEIRERNSLAVKRNRSEKTSTFTLHRTYILREIFQKFPPPPPTAVNTADGHRQPPLPPPPPLHSNPLNPRHLTPPHLRPPCPLNNPPRLGCLAGAPRRNNPCTPPEYSVNGEFPTIPFHRNRLEISRATRKSSTSGIIHFPAKSRRNYRHSSVSEFLDLSSNRFSGELGFLKYFPNLEKLYLDNNKFAGKVPPAPENQKTNNKRLPKRYIFAGSSNSNNLTSPATSPAPANTPKHKHRKKTHGLDFWVFCRIFSRNSFRHYPHGGRNDAGPVIFTPSVQAEDLKAEDLAFLENDDEVAALQVIGRGGCGDVYKTEMPNGKFQTVAIKRIVQPPKDAEDVTVEDTKLLDKKMRQMQSEIQTVGQIRHRNLLPLLAHVPRRTCHYLVYEFMKNGSLQDLLEEVNAGTRELDWLARHRIAIGVVSGLEYLHIDHIPRIIHRDLKPANVLLDDNMEPRIADFGLAKLMAEADTHMTSSNIAWTPGYIAPEYHQTMKITDKCDIYSFGVLLGVLVIGKFPSDEFFQQTPENSLVKWMRQVMSSEDPTQAIDPNLLGNGYEKQMLCVLRIAYFCTLDNPKERPNSKKCRCMLNEIEY
ncbi:hypothetical protein OSB04_005044 [Centaurea solstitialis]|uniref:Protein kinase domain-containing protein n=1 Tax=Centaurea solstitialis TaxID=347529 RepID=A0AA38TH13_9ASTR|nr:hypothetical protein OSB04_005044 [Centaurea solstitialis]